MRQKNLSSFHSDWDVRSIDLWTFARIEGQASGELPLTALPRLLNEAAHPLPANLPTFSWHASGEIRVECVAMDKTIPVPYLQLALTGVLCLACQRCLAPYPHPVSVHLRYRIVETEQQAEAAPINNDEVEVIVGAPAFDLLDLIDQELCLALPLVPKHPVCPTLHQALHIEPDRSSLTPDRPFAALAALKRTRNSN